MKDSRCNHERSRHSDVLVSSAFFIVLRKLFNLVELPISTMSDTYNMK